MESIDEKSTNITEKNIEKEENVEELIYDKNQENEEYEDAMELEGSYIEKKFIKKLFTDKEDLSLQVLSVIVTFCSGTSYDNLFREVEQKAPEGGRVSVYSISLEGIDKLLKIMESDNIQDQLARYDDASKKILSDLIFDINQIEPECTIFNFECCEGCTSLSDFKFPKETETLKFTKLVIDRGHMTMFSDFAVKALISSWDVNYLGSNPFKLIGTCDMFIKLNFDCQKLKDSHSEQLKIVGNLSQNGEANIHALSETVVFGLDKEKIDPLLYELEILTIVTDTKYFDFNNQECSKYLYELVGKKGSIGHAVLTYNSKGIMILSSGHWVELSNLNVDINKLITVSNNIGGDYLKEMEKIQNCEMDDYEKTVKYKELSTKFVKQSAPCKYSKKAKISRNKNED